MSVSSSMEIYGDKGAFGSHMTVVHSQCICESVLPWLTFLIKCPAAPWFSAQAHGSRCMLDRLQLQTGHWSGYIDKGLHRIKSVLTAIACELQSHTDSLEKWSTGIILMTAYRAGQIDSAGQIDLLRLRSGHWAMNPWGMTSNCTSCIIPCAWKHEKSIISIDLNYAQWSSSWGKMLRKRSTQTLVSRAFQDLFLTRPCQGKSHQAKQRIILLFSPW